MPTDLIGRTAIVTGAAGPAGLGHAIARELALRGAVVVVHDIAAPDVSVEAIREAGGSAIPFTSDITEEAGVVALTRFAVAETGRLDILVNNAGIGHLCGPLVDFEASDWDLLFAINLRACFLTIKHAARQMRAQTVQGEEWGAGRIVSIASQAAKTGFAFHAAYSASKHGLLGLTRAAAMELGPAGITVNAICPNHMDTAMASRLDRMMADEQGLTLEAYRAAMVARVPMGRLGRTTDSAAVCGFLCSKEAAYITGEAWNVAGGEETH